MLLGDWLLEGPQAFWLAAVLYCQISAQLSIHLSSWQPAANHRMRAAVAIAFNIPICGEQMSGRDSCNSCFLLVGPLLEQLALFPSLLRLQSEYLLIEFLRNVFEKLIVCSTLYKDFLRKMLGTDNGTYLFQNKNFKICFTLSKAFPLSKDSPRETLSISKGKILNLLYTF
jgi:hypothetical protein